MVRLRVVGAAPGAEVHDASAVLYGIPRKGEQLSVWVAPNVEVFVEVGDLTWPTWGDGHAAPDVYLARPDDMDDQEWADVFAAINEQRSP